MTPSKYRITLSILLLLVGNKLIADSTDQSGSKNAVVPETVSVVPDTNNAPNGAVLAAWTQFVRSDIKPNTLLSTPTVVARFVVQGKNQQCAQYSVKTLPVVTNNIQPQARQFPLDEAAFPITVCQFEMPVSADSATLVMDTAPLTLWQQNDDPQQSTGPQVNFTGAHSIGRKNADELVMVSLGDTGCRHYLKAGRLYQPDCGEDSVDWPFYTLIKAAVTKHPDFVVHVGDYRYRDESVNPDTWNYWYQDFFHPAQALLLEAPWALSRGNHEQCVSESSYYYFGSAWYYFFEPTLSHEVRRCPENGQGILEKNWYFDVAVHDNKTSLYPSRFVMLDTASDARHLSNYNTEITARIKTAFQDARANPTISTWWITHRPAVRLFYYRARWNYGEATIVAAMNEVLHDEESQLCTEGKCSPTMILSGHTHAYQLISFMDEANKPTQPQYAIVGNGGVNDEASSEMRSRLCTHTFDGDAMPDGIQRKGTVATDFRHGFITWRRSATTLTEPSGWSPEYYYFEGKNKSRAPLTLEACAQAQGSG